MKKITYSGLQWLVALGLLFYSNDSHSQCTSCTDCSSSEEVSCTTTIFGDNSTNITVNAGQKLCIVSGTYTGRIILKGGTIKVYNGATFEPSFFSVSNAGSLVEINDGAVAEIPSVTISSSVSLVFNNCGNLQLNADYKVSSGGSGSINNRGTFHSLFDIKYSGNSYGTICNSGNMYFNTLNLSNSTNSLVNNGTLLLSGDMNMSNHATATICSGSYIGIDGDWNASTGASTNAPSSCGAIKVNGYSNCSSCSMSGYLDFCDVSDPAPNNTPKVDNNSGGSWGSNITYCTCFVLPVELLFFNASFSNRNVNTEWITASETNNDYFTLERSPDGVFYESVATIKGAGNSNRLISYSFTDENPLPGVSYYRLKQTDFDGRTQLFSPVAVRNSRMTIYPNPVLSDLQLFVNSGTDEEGEVRISIFDISGKMILAKNDFLTKGSNMLFIDASGIANGVYLLKAETPNGHYFARFMK